MYFLENYSLIQQISFWAATAGSVLFALYLILIWAGYYNVKAKYVSDDIDMPNDVNENFIGFMAAALTVRGTIIIVAFGGWSVFGLSFFLEDWLALTLGIIIGVLASVIATFILRRKTIVVGKLAVVNVKIPRKGEGRIILEDDGTEARAVSEKSKVIKSGKLVEIVGEKPGYVIVRKISSSANRINEYII